MSKTDKNVIYIKKIALKNSLIEFNFFFFNVWFVIQIFIYLGFSFI